MQWFEKDSRILKLNRDVYIMYDEEIICPYCGSKTPKVNYCANCGNRIKEYVTGSNEDPLSQEEAIKAALTVSDISKSSLRGHPKHIFLSTNYLIEEEASSADFLGNVMSMEYGSGDVKAEVYEAIDIEELRQEEPYLKIIPYTGIEKAELRTSRWNTYLEIESPSFTRKYILGAEKFHDLLFEKISKILQPKMGERFVVK